jgi:UDP-glucose 4-epimerase
MMSVLVTGGASYIGSQVCKALAAAVYRPIAYENLSAGHIWAVKSGPLERGDILDGLRLEEVLRAYRPVVVMHFAALAYVEESVDKPDRYYRNTVVGTLSLLEAMLECDVSKIGFSSSCAKYGIPDTIPISEDSRQSPINPHGRTNLMMEQVLKDYGSSYALRSVTLRYFNAAGADPDGEIGEDHDPETHLVPIVLETAAGLSEDGHCFWK